MMYLQIHFGLPQLVFRSRFAGGASAGTTAAAMAENAAVPPAASVSATTASPSEPILLPTRESALTIALAPTTGPSGELFAARPYVCNFVSAATVSYRFLLRPSPRHLFSLSSTLFLA